MGHAKRRRRQAVNGYTHLAKLGRPIYRKHALSNLGETIQKERARAARLAQIKRK